MEKSVKLEYVAPLKQYKRPIAVFVAAAAISVAVYKIVVPDYYLAAATLAPTSRNNIATSSLSQLSGLASLAGVGLGRPQNATNFDRFMYLLMAPEMARELLKRREILAYYYPDWDPAAGKWHYSVLRGLATVILGDKLPPTPSAFAEKLERAVSIKSVPSADSTNVLSNLYSIQFREKDPHQAQLMLDLIINKANDILRADDAETARAQAHYLEDKLRTVGEQEYRETLLKLYTEQEQTLMLASSNPEYAGEVLTKNAMYPERENKKTLLTIAVAICVAFSFAYFLAILAFNLQAGGAGMIGGRSESSNRKR